MSAWLGSGELAQDRTKGTWVELSMGMVRITSLVVWHCPWAGNARWEISEVAKGKQQAK